MAAQFARSVIP